MRRGRLQLGQGKNAAPNYASALAMLDLNFGKSLVTIRNPTIGNLYRTRFQLFDFLTAKQHIQLHPHHLRQPTCRFRGVFTVLSRSCGTRKSVGCPNRTSAHNRRPRLCTAPDRVRPIPWFARHPGRRNRSALASMIATAISSGDIIDKRARIIPAALREGAEGLISPANLTEPVQ